MVRPDHWWLFTPFSIFFVLGFPVVVSIIWLTRRGVLRFLPVRSGDGWVLPSGSSWSAWMIVTLWREHCHISWSVMQLSCMLSCCFCQHLYHPQTLLSPRSWTFAIPFEPFIPHLNIKLLLYLMTLAWLKTNQLILPVLVSTPLIFFDETWIIEKIGKISCSFNLEGRTT